MSALISGVTSRVRAMMPEYENRWTDAEIQTLVHTADLAVREGASVEWASHEIELIDGAYYYALPTDVVEVRSVEFSRDGLTYEGGWLECVSFEDMDDVSATWQTDAGTEPSLFSLLSVPGTTTYSKIMIWRPILSTSGQKVRVNYIKCRAAESDLTGQSMPDEVQERVYIPYVMSLMKQLDDPQMAAEYMAEYRRNLGWVKARYGHRNVERRRG